MNLRRSLRLLALGLGASSFVNADCNPPTSMTLGNLQVVVNGNVAFKSATGLDQSFFSSDKALGPAQLVGISSVQELVVHYDDPFSTFNDPNSESLVGSAQEEVLVLARDPVEYRTTLEHIGGAGDPLDFGENLIWAQQTFAPGDTWPIVATSGTPPQPNGVTLPDAVHFPFPNKHKTPDVDWRMTQDLFTGSSSTPFAGDAASYGGTIKGLSVIQRGLCSHPEPLQGSLNSIASIPLSANILGMGYDAVLGASSFVDYAPKGGLVVMLYVAATDPVPVPIPPFFQQPTFTRNVTYYFELDDGIVTLSAPTFNIANTAGLDFYAFGGLLDGKLKHDVPNTVKLAALEGAKGSFTGGQAQPIPSGLKSAVNAKGQTVQCDDTTQLRPAACFVGCDDANGIVMSKPNTWVPPFGNVPPESVGDSNNVDPASWHDTSYLSTAYNKTRFAVLASSATYPGMTQCGPTALANAMTENMPLPDGTTDGNKYHNIRCNFYPQYEEATGVAPILITPPCEFGASALVA